MNLTTSIKNVMTPDAIYVDQFFTMEQVSDIFESKPIHHLPVVDDNLVVVGMISKSDYYKLQHCLTFFKSKKIKDYNSALMRSLLAKDIMTKQVVTLLPESPLSQAFDLFRENLFHAIPIVDEDKHLLGIVSTFDLLNYAYNS